MKHFWRILDTAEASQWTAGHQPQLPRTSSGPPPLGVWVGAAGGNKSQGEEVSEGEFRLTGELTPDDPAEPVGFVNYYAPLARS